MRPVLAELNGLSASAAARELEQRGYATARGGKWSATLVIQNSGSPGGVVMRLCRRHPHHYRREPSARRDPCLQHIVSRLSS